MQDKKKCILKNELLVATLESKNHTLEEFFLSLKFWLYFHQLKNPFCTIYAMLYIYSRHFYNSLEFKKQQYHPQFRCEKQVISSQTTHKL